ncbi:MAG TPA: HAD-IIIC family phosphatase [Terriglobales bacterium]|nr:HAD-IIIC family phosphatase [Terriglobales bacterium]
MTIAETPAAVLLRKQRALRRELQRPNMLQTRIAFLCGSTPNEVAGLLELLLLEQGIEPVFYFSDYNKYFEEAVLDPARLIEFKPDIVFVYTSTANIQGWPAMNASEADLRAHVAAENMRFTAIWNALEQSIKGVIIQNNFELPQYRLLGNLDATSPAGRTRYVNLLNAELTRDAASRRNVFINDLNSVAASVGLKTFHDPGRWFSYKIATTPEASLEVAKSAAAIVRAVYGRMRKCLVLDLDNTLWGGVIGDDGPDKIRIGKETAEAEAYTAFQEYCLQLRSRGVLLAVCSKNSEAIARKGFEHPDSVLKQHHFSCFKANWEPKHENLKAIAAELNIGLDSLVFVDDNPAEREIVSAQLPMVAVPNVGSDVTRFIPLLEDGRYFEPARLSREDLNRAQQYEENAQRESLQSRFQNYEEYLESLEMSAEIAAFKPVYLDRITQLINKTNQFNLTTRRYTQAQVEAIAGERGYIALYGKLSDKFGDNGLISVIIGRKEKRVLHLDLWIMSCRVLKRGMEAAMLDALVAECREHGVSEIRGYYIPTERNGLVAEHYAALGFEAAGGNGQTTEWKMAVTDGYAPRNRHIKEFVHE